MEFIKTKLKDLYIIKPNVFSDARGYFFESYNKGEFEANGISLDFLQDNESKSEKNVLRGLHFQNPPHAQGKLVRVVKGSVLDVAVDIRITSPTYGQYVSAELSEENKMMMWIPEGFAHGFLTLRDDTVFVYKCTQVYNKASEDAILWNDSNLAIDWNVKNPILSEKDKSAKPFSQLVSQF